MWLAGEPAAGAAAAPAEAGGRLGPHRVDGGGRPHREPSLREHTISPAARSLLQQRRQGQRVGFLNSALRLPQAAPPLAKCLHCLLSIIGESLRTNDERLTEKSKASVTRFRVTTNERARARESRSHASRWRGWCVSKVRACLLSSLF